jgi:hypothetical protein
MQQSPSWEANHSLQLVKKFPASLWNPKVLYFAHKYPSLVPILSRLYPVLTTYSSFLKIHLNIVIPSTSGSPQWPLSLRFSHQHPVHSSLNTLTTPLKGRLCGFSTITHLRFLGFRHYLASKLLRFGIHCNLHIHKSFISFFVIV